MILTNSNISRCIQTETNGRNKIEMKKEATEFEITGDNGIYTRVKPAFQLSISTSYGEISKPSS